MAISINLNPPNRQNDSSAQFVQKADAFANDLVSWTGQVNETAEQVNLDAGAAAGSASAAGISASNAAGSASAAAQSALIAQGVANYQGEYDAGTFYAVGESVTYLGSQFVKKTGAPAGTTPVDGVDWLGVVAGFVPTIEVFSTSGTWTKPAGCTLVYVEAVAGGGGGSNYTSGTDGAGGAGGEYVDYIFNADDLGDSEVVTTGAGGAGGASGSDTNGSQGGSTTFGAHLTAIGGRGGIYAQGGTPGRVFSTGTSDSNVVGVILHSNAAPGGNNVRAGGATVNGGGGGGGARGTGGPSANGGNGGAGNNTASTKGGNGATPGGGGGGSSNDGGGGDGGDGWCRVTCW